MNSEWLHSILVRVPAFILGIGLHEWSHAFVADRAGDPTPREQGRLTLDLVTHLDPLGTLCMLVGPIGWGRAVEVLPSNFRDPGRDHMRVALAGPLMNVVLGAAGLLVLGLLRLVDPKWLKTAAGDTLWKMVAWIVLMNVGLALFNLIPIPPLDGSKVLAYHMGDSGSDYLRMMQPVGLMMIARLSYTGAFDSVLDFGILTIRSILSHGILLQAVVFTLAIGAWLQNAEVLSARDPTGKDPRVPE